MISHCWSKKTLCSHRCISRNMPGVVALQRQNLKLGCSVLKFKQKSSVSSKLLVTVQKDSFILTLKYYISKFQKVWKRWIWRKVSRNYAFCFSLLWLLTGSQVINDKMQNIFWFDLINSLILYVKRNIRSSKEKSQKESLYLLLYHTSMFICENGFVIHQ